MKLLKSVVVAIAIIIAACSTPNETAKKAQPSLPDYNSPADLFKSEQCSKQVEHSHGDRVLTLKPRYKLLHEDADIFCVQKLQKHNRFLKVTSTLDPWVEEKPTQDQLKFFATAFDLVVYDKTMTQLSMPKPVFQLMNANEFNAYYDFSKLKKFPVYFAILFKREDRQNPIFTKTSQNSAEHSSVTSAMGAAMGGFVAAPAVSMSQQKNALSHVIYSKNPVDLQAEWVSGIPASK